MSRDPAFLFYDGDAARDVSHMTRLQRGCYFDLIQAQRKFGSFSEEEAKRILGKDFAKCWPSVAMSLSTTDGRYFIQWVKDSMEKRQRHCDMQSARALKKWHGEEDNSASIRHQSGDAAALPPQCLKENENENEGKKEGVVGEEVFFDFEVLWSQYPNKDGKKSALSHFNSSVKTRKDWDDINASLKNYLGSKNVKEGFIKNGSTWFNNWRDWVSPSPVMMSNPKTQEEERIKRWRKFLSETEDKCQRGKISLAEKERLLKEWK